MAEIVITSSFIKTLFHKGEIREGLCYKKIYALFFEGEREPSTETQSYGLYFETMAIGSSARDEKTIDLPRKPNGTKTAVQQRLDAQIENLRAGMIEHYINIVPNLNTQVKICKRWSDDIILCATYDIFPTTILYKGEILPLASIDLKVTKDIDSTWGDYSWGAVEHMDHTQLVFQHYLAKEFDIKLNHSMNPEIFEKGLIRKETMSHLNDLPVFYWVFEYGTKLRNMLIRVNVDNLRMAELKETIRKTVANYRYCPLARHNGGLCMETTSIKEV